MKKIIAFAILVLFWLTSLAHAGIQTSIVAFWPFGDANTATTLTDSTGRGNTLSPNLRIKTSTNEFMMGEDSANSWQALIGSMKGWGRWTRMLTSSEKIALAGGEYWPFSVTTTLQDAKVYYLLDEASNSATYADATGRGNTLTRTGTLTQVTGPLGGVDHGTYFGGSSNLYITTPGTDIQAGQINTTVAGWVSIASKSNAQECLWSQLTDITHSGVNFAYATPPDDFCCDNDGGDNQTLSHGTLNFNTLAPTLNTWYFVLFEFDLANNRTTVAVNNGTPSVINNILQPVQVVGAVGYASQFFNNTPLTFSPLQSGWDSGGAGDPVSGNSYVSEATNADITIGTNLKSIWGWFYDTDVTTDQIVAGKWGFTTGTTDWLLEISSGNLSFKFGSTQTTATRSVSASAWHFFIAWWDGTNINLNVDNGTTTSVSGATAQSVSSALTIGSMVTAKQFTGKVQDWGIANGTPTSGDITALYNGGVPFDSTATQTTYYSDFATGSDSNTGTQASPWKYMPGMSGWTGSATLSSGDTVVLKGGSTWTFASTTANLITITTPITIVGGQLLSTPWGSGYPIIDGSGSTATRSAIYDYSPAYALTVNGIKIYNVGYSGDGSGWGVLFINASNLTVENCWFETSAVDGIAVGNSVNNTTMNNILIHDNIFKAQGRNDIEACSGPLSGTCTSEIINNIQIYNNTFYGPHTAGAVYNNYSFHGEALMVAGGNADTYGITNMVIHHNHFVGDWCQNNGGAPGSGMGVTAIIYLSGNYSPMGYSDSGTLIYDNLFEDDSADCQYSDSTWEAPLSAGAIRASWGYHQNLQIYNNTFWDNADAPTSAGWGMGVSVGDNTGYGVHSGVVIENNIFARCDNCISLGQDVTTATMNDNQFWSMAGQHLIYDNRGGANRCNTCATCLTQESGSGLVYCNDSYSAGNNLFVALPTQGTAGSGNFNIIASSPAIGNGTNLSSIFTTDILGVTWTVPYGIGAYQYSGTSTVGIPAVFGAYGRGSTIYH